ncbi:hypothetical protein BIV09_23610 [Pseudomonas sp. 7SR1]|nr:hypothetical protein BIV09_23610 [Pseudomonas sp. 7SR1]
MVDCLGIENKWSGICTISKMKMSERTGKKRETMPPRSILTRLLLEYRMRIFLMICGKKQIGLPKT